MIAEQLTETTSAKTNRVIPIWEIASVVISCLIAEWVVLSLGVTTRWLIAVPSSMALILMILSHRERGESFRDIGFRLDNFLDASRLLFFPTAAAIVLILISALLLSDSSFTMRSVRPRFLLLPLWTLLQQYALQGFINRRAQMAFGKGFNSIVLVGVVFSLLHFPNPLLSGLTLIGGLIWAAVYQRQPNLLALALSHAAVSIVLALTIPPEVTENLRVGFRYFG